MDPGLRPSPRKVRRHDWASSGTTPIATSTVGTIAAKNVATSNAAIPTVALPPARDLLH